MLRILLVLFAVALSLQPTLVLAVEGEQRPLVNPLFLEMVWSLVLFVLFFAALSYFVWPKILVALRERESKIRRDLERAEQAAKGAGAKLDEYNAKLADAQETSQKVIDQARSDAERVAAQLKDQTQNEIVAMKDRAAQEIDAAKRQALSEIYQQTASLVTQVAGQVLQREVRVEDQQQLINDSIEQFRQSQQN